MNKTPALNDHVICEALQDMLRGRTINNEGQVTDSTDYVMTLCGVMEKNPSLKPQIHALLTSRNISELIQQYLQRGNALGHE